MMDAEELDGLFWSLAMGFGLIALILLPFFILGTIGCASQGGC